MNRSSILSAAIALGSVDSALACDMPALTYASGAIKAVADDILKVESLSSRIEQIRVDLDVNIVEVRLIGAEKSDCEMIRYSAREDSMCNMIVKRTFSFSCEP